MKQKQVKDQAFFYFIFIKSIKYISNLVCTVFNLMKMFKESDSQLYSKITSYTVIGLGLGLPQTKY